MKKFFYLLVVSVLLYQCDSSSDPMPTPTPQPGVAGVASGLLLDDVTNSGDASDYLLTFATPADESTILEFRAILVNSATGSINLAGAEALATDRYMVIPKSGNSISTALSATLLDSDGATITEGNSYAAYILSVADGTNAVENSLSAPSNSFELAQTTIKITYLQNDGVMITDGTSKVIIDALFTNSGWRDMSTGMANSLNNGQSPYDQANVVMVTHNHGDHYSISSVGSYLNSSPSTRFISTSQVNSNIGNASQIENVAPAADSSILVTVNGVEIEILDITHFNPQDGTNFSTTLNYAYIVSIGGLKILHIGDGDLSASNFSKFNLKDEGIDVALIPTFVFSGQLTQTNRDVLVNLIAPANIIGLHLATGTTVSQVTNIHPDAIVFTTPLQFVRF